LIFTNYFNTFFGNVYKSYGSGIGGIDDETLTWTASIGAISNCISRLVFGKLIDKMGFKKLYTILLFLQLTNTVISYFCVHIAPIYFFCVLLNNFCLGASFLCMTTVCARIFGSRWGASVYSVVLIGSLISSTLNIGNAQLIDLTGGFFISFLSTFLATLFCFAILYSFEEKLDV
jgi:MFS family permease